MITRLTLHANVEADALASCLLNCYRSQMWATLIVSGNALDLRWWLEVIDYIDAAGYHPQRVINGVGLKVEHNNIYPDYIYNKPMRDSFLMALAIWKRGYSAAKVGAA